MTSPTQDKNQLLYELEHAETITECLTIYNQLKEIEESE